MLNIYCGRASQDLPASMFNLIKGRLAAIRSGASKAKQLLLVVPAQFTLQAEDKAFSELKEEGFFDLQILSGNKLRADVLRETGGAGYTAVNTLGRAMLLRKIARDKGGGLQAFSKVASDSEFLSLAGDMIVQLKQNDISLPVLDGIINGAGGSGLLGRKLADMRVIYGAYEEAMSGRYTDSEDLLMLTTEKLKESRRIAESEIWYYGFYSFTKRETAFLAELSRCSCGLNMMLMLDPEKRADEDLFEVTRRSAAALAAAVPDTQVFGADGFPLERPEVLKAVERSLYAFPAERFDGDASGLTLIECSSPFSQAETLASEILRRVREGRCAFSDIAVLTEDMPGQGEVIKRVFGSLGIPVFMDEKRAVRHDPAIMLLQALLNCVSQGFPASDVLAFVKPGLCGVEGDTDEFENYVKQYHIRGERFHKPFRYGEKALGPERFAAVEEMRGRLSALLLPFAGALGAAPTVREKTTVLYNFLAGTLRLEDRLAEKAAGLAEQGMTDAAEELSQIWAVITGLMDQTVELLGDEQADNAEFARIFEDSFSDIKVGLLPQAEGRVLLGTVKRSNLRDVKVLFIAGLNDGVIPSDQEVRSLLTEKELEQLEAGGFRLAKNNDTAAEEERFLIYRAFSSPSDELIVSWLLADGEGHEMKPSQLVSQLKAVVPGLAVIKDIENRGDDMAFMEGRPLAVTRLGRALQDELSEAARLSDVMKEGYDSLKRSADPGLEAVIKGLEHRNSREVLGPQRSGDLFADSHGEQSYSPSRLEGFAGCPFSHFISKGLRPEDRRPFGINGAEIGTIDHECLLRLCEKLNESAKKQGIAVSDPGSSWMTVSEGELRAMIDDILEQMSSETLEGVMSAGKPEIYRSRRIKEVCFDFAKQMVAQVRVGKIKSMDLEIPFGLRRKLPAFDVETKFGTVHVEGKIDRADILAGPEGTDYVKIIDYKSGQKSFKREEFEQGVSLQLMVYLEGELGAREGAKPAGVFYYSIKDPTEEAPLGDLDAESVAEDAAARLASKYALDGIAVGERGVLDAIDKELYAGGRSGVLGVKLNKDGEISSKKVISSEEFEDFRRSFSAALKAVCEDLRSGNIAADPKNDACRYCEYRSVCAYDKAFK